MVFIYAQSQLGQDLFLRGGSRDGSPIRIRHRNWLNPHTNYYRWGDAYLDWGDGEVGQARPSPDIGGGSPADWTTSLAEGQGQPYTWTAGYGIADENNFGMHYWMLDVDMDCEQAFDDGQGRKWFELKSFMVTMLMTAVAPNPGWGGDICANKQSNAALSIAESHGHLRDGQRVRGQIPQLTDGLDPNSAKFFRLSYRYLALLDERGAPDEVMNKTPCLSPGVEKRCLGKSR